MLDSTGLQFTVVVGELQTLLPDIHSKLGG